MTATTSAAVVVSDGVDTHRDQHVAATSDQLGRVLATASFSPNVSGYQRLHRWLAAPGTDDKVGVVEPGATEQP